MRTLAQKTEITLPRLVLYSGGNDAGGTVHAEGLQFQNAQDAGDGAEHLFQSEIRAFGLREDRQRGELGECYGVSHEVNRKDGRKDRVFEGTAAIFYFGRDRGGRGDDDGDRG